MPQFGLGFARRFIDDVIASPLNMALVALICYFSYKLLKRDPNALTSKSKYTKPDSNSRSNRKKLDKMPKQDFTLEQLKKYDGSSTDEDLTGRILVGILGKVFDVSQAHDFYGPGGPYSVFAGRDASRALATFSVDASQFKDGEYDDLSGLKPSELESVKEWEMQFLGK
jgi:membrane-associated progesterone receptor component